MTGINDLEDLQLDLHWAAVCTGASSLKFTQLLSASACPARLVLSSLIPFRHRWKVGSHRSSWEGAGGSRLPFRNLDQRSPKGKAFDVSYNKVFSNSCKRVTSTYYTVKSIWTCCLLIIRTLYLCWLSLVVLVILARLCRLYISQPEFFAFPSKRVVWQVPCKYGRSSYLLISTTAHRCRQHAKYMLVYWI